MRLVAVSSALVIIFCVAGCTVSEDTAPTAEPTPTPSASSQSEAPEVNAHGHLPKSLNESGAILFPGTNDPAVSFRITGVNSAPECDPLFYVPPQNGSYVVIDVEFTTDEDYLRVMPGMIPLRWFWYDFTSYDAEGTATANTANSVTCLNQEASGPMDLPAGAVTIKRYAIDVPPGTTSVAVVPEMFGDVPGWEWPLE